MKIDKFIVPFAIFGALFAHVDAQEIQIPHRDTIHVEEIIISANRSRTIRREAPSLVEIANIQKITATGAVCPAQTLDFISGLRVEDNCQNCGFTQVRMNGLDGHYTQILIDSKPLFSALSGVYGLEQIPTEMIEQIEVMRGGGSALFGASAIGGVINIITKEATGNKAGFGHNFQSTGISKSFDNTTNAYASATSTDNKSGIYLFFQNRHRDAYDHNKDGFSDIPKLQNTALGLNAYVRPTRFSKLSLRYNFISDEHRGGNKLNLQPHESNISEGASHNIHSGHLEYHIDYGNQHFETYLAMQHIFRNSYYGGTYSGSEEEIADALKAYGYTRNLTLASGAMWRYNFEKLWFMPASLTLGAEYNYDFLSDSIPGYEKFLRQNVHIGGIYAQNEWKNDKLSLLFGLRADKHSLLKNPIFSPRINIRYTPIRPIALRFSYASGFRAPQTYDEDLHVSLAGGERIISTLAENLKEERSQSFSLSVDYCHWVNNIDIDFTAESFVTMLNNIFAERRYEDLHGNEISERYNAGKGYVAGLHAATKIAYNHWITAQVGVTWQVGKYNAPVEWSEDAEPESRMLRMPNLYGYFILESNPWKKLKLNLNGNLTGKMLVPHESEVAILEKTPAFFTLNAQISYNFNILTKKSENSHTLTLTAGIRNIFNSYQKDLEVGIFRDSDYIYGPSLPRSLYFSLKFDL